MSYTAGVTSVDCHKQVRSWRLLRSLLEFLIPSCFVMENHQDHHINNKHNFYYIPKPSFPCRNTITGTIFGYRRGKFSFCIQSNSKSTSPILLLEFVVPTTVLAKEMQGGTLRIALECKENRVPGNSGNSQPLLSTSVWRMYCNSRKVGYAMKRNPIKADIEALRVMSSVIVGAGVISGKELDQDDELLYLRASFERVKGSSESESFHLIDPDGNIGQELSIFFFR